MGRVQRRQLLIGAIVLATPLRLLAQGVSVRRIGYLLFVPLVDPPSRERQAFLDGMREFGHVPGKTVEIVYSSAEGEPDFIGDACQDLLRQKVELIVASGPTATLAAKKATSTVPIVMQAVGDPIGIGVVRYRLRAPIHMTSGCPLFRRKSPCTGGAGLYTHRASRAPVPAAYLFRSASQSPRRSSSLR